MKTFNCSRGDWPICLYDFTYKNRIPTYFCFKVQPPLADLLIPNYFYSEDPIILLKPDLSVLVERNVHFCSDSVTTNFKQLYKSNNP